MDWDRLKTFRAVADAGSLTAASKELNTSQSAVSRQIAALEESLQVPLFYRHARGLLLTEEGEILYHTAQDVFSRIELTTARISDSKKKPRGEIRINTTVGFGTIWLTPQIRHFIEAYPEIHVTLHLTEDPLDLTMREADVGLRFVPATHPDIVQSRIQTVHTHIYGSPAYLARHTMPTSAEGLNAHKLIVYGPRPPVPARDINWTLNAGTKTPRKPVLKINNLTGVMLAVESGLGLAALPDYLVRNNDRIVRVLPELSGPELDLFLTYPTELRNTNRIRVFRDFILSRITQTKF